MSQNIAAWYIEKVRDQVVVLFQANGGLLDGTMVEGDVVANTIKFPIIGRTEVYKLSGAIERVPVGGPGLSTVTLTADDFEASDWWRVQDAYKAGPNEQAALAQIIVKAVRRKRDKLKIDALAAFSSGNFGVRTIGDGTGIIDILDTEQARAEVAATGAENFEMFCLLPAMWMSQLKFYKEFSSAEYIGNDNLPWSNVQRALTRTVSGVHYIEGPDEYFAGPDANSLYAYMWAKEAMGATMPINQEAPSISRHEEMQGSPYLIKSMLSGGAVGIQAAGVKRLHFEKIDRPVRPAILTQQAA